MDKEKDEKNKKDNVISLEKKLKEHKEEEEHDESECPVCTSSHKQSLFNDLMEGCYNYLEHSSLCLMEIISTIEDVKLELYKDHIEARTEDMIDKKLKEKLDGNEQN